MRISIASFLLENLPLKALAFSLSHTHEGKRLVVYTRSSRFRGCPGRLQCIGLHFHNMLAI